MREKMKLFSEEVDSPQNLIRKVSSIICTTVGIVHSSLID